MAMAYNIEKGIFFFIMVIKGLIFEILIYMYQLPNLMIPTNSLIPFIASGAMLTVAIILGIRSIGDVKEKALLRWLIPIFSISFVVFMILGVYAHAYDMTVKEVLNMSIIFIIFLELIPSLICIIIWMKKKK